MSIPAMKWAVEQAPPMPAQLVATLVGLAYHADQCGHSAYPSLPTLAAYTCKSERSVRRDLRDLEKLGLIRRGNPAAVVHLPADRRPEVYDLAVENKVRGGRAGADEGTSTSAREVLSARARGGRKKPEREDVHVRADADDRGDVDVTDGGTPTSRTGGRPRPPNQKTEPTTEPKDSCSPPEAESESAPGLFVVPNIDTPPAAVDSVDRFDDFWTAYPRKEGKGHARKAYAAAIKRGMTPDKLLAATRAHAAHWQATHTAKKWIPHPTTWLNGERYDDELPNAAEALAPTGTGGYQPYSNPVDQSAYDEWN